VEELDIFFGGAEDSTAESDRLRMQRINESLGLAGLESVEDLKTDKHAATEQVEYESTEA
jgi:hypothetical protein